MKIHEETEIIEGEVVEVQIDRSVTGVRPIPGFVLTEGYENRKVDDKNYRYGYHLRSWYEND